MQRDGSGRFLPGQSANPGGRPSGVKELRELTRQYTHEAVDVLVKHLNDPDPRVALFAANSLLDRGYGKPSPASGRGPNGPREGAPGGAEGYYGEIRETALVDAIRSF